MNERRDEFQSLTTESGGVATSARAARVGERAFEGAIELRPRGVGAVLDLGLDLVRTRFASCFVLGALLWLPWRLLAAEVVVDPATMDRTDPFAAFRVLGGAALSNGVYYVLHSVITAFSARILFDAASGVDTSVGSALALVVRKLPGILVLAVVSGLLILAGTAACVLPVFGVMWAVTPLMLVYVLEDSTVGRALPRSFGLSFENLFSWPSFYAFWRWAGIMLVSSWLVFPLTGLVGGLDVPEVRAFVLDTVGCSSGALHAFSVVAGALCLGAAIAVQAGILTAYYIDLRVRRDGLDLATWLAKLAPARGAAA